MESFWSTFRLDPRLPRNAPLRASDADREVVRNVLGDAFADGRLTREEYDDRLTRLFETRTLGDLPALVDDLVDPEDPPAEPRTAAVVPRPGAEIEARAEAAYRRELSGAFGTFLLVGLITWMIWLSGGVHHFAWPVFPTAIFGIRLVKTINRRDASIDQTVGRLQRRQGWVEQPPKASKEPPEDRPDDRE